MVQAFALLELLLAECVDHPGSHAPLLGTLLDCAERIDDRAFDSGVVPALLDRLLLLPSRWLPVVARAAGTVAATAAAPVATTAKAGNAAMKAQAVSYTHLTLPTTPYV